VAWGSERGYSSLRKSIKYVSLLVVSFVDWTEGLEDPLAHSQSDDEEEAIHHIAPGDTPVSVSHHRNVSTSSQSGLNRQLVAPEQITGPVLSVGDDEPGQFGQEHRFERIDDALYPIDSPATERRTDETLSFVSQSPSISTTVIDNFHTPTETALRDEHQNSKGLFPLSRADAALVRHFFRVLAPWVSIFVTAKHPFPHCDVSSTTATCAVNSPLKYLDDWQTPHLFYMLSLLYHLSISMCLKGMTRIKPTDTIRPASNYSYLNSRRMKLFFGKTSSQPL
jgi:hypothetical protein